VYLGTKVLVAYRTASLTIAVLYGLGGPGWSTAGWFVVAGWTVALPLLAVYAYRRDTRRV
jgi:hypothetical protein